MTLDTDLLRDYAESRSEAAFAELVRLNLPLVYFAALRRTSGNTSAAEDIAQEVFITLARQAASLARHETLIGWLYTTTRFTAAKAIRAESRRKVREHEAHIMNELTHDAEASVVFEKLQPVIDEALEKLDPADREAVIMRFLQNRSFGEIGAALRLTEDAARKRVTRALDKLKVQLARRGLTSTAVALATGLSHQAGMAAPAGLHASVTSAALASMGAISSVSPAAAIVFSMINKKMILGGSALLGLVGLSTALYHSVRPNTSDTLKQASTALASKGSQPPKDDVSHALTVLQQENQKLRALVESIGQAGTNSVIEKVAKLRIMLERLPEQGIPEFALINEDDWYAAVDGPLESVDDYRRSFSKLRARAEKRFAEKAQPALAAFVRAHEGEFPKSPDQLKPLFEGQLDESIFKRYKIVPAEELRSLKMGGEWIMTQMNLIDSAYDSRIGIGSHGHGTYTKDNRMNELLAPVIQGFTQANPGVQPINAAQLRPFATSPEQRTALDSLERNLSRR